MTEFRIAENTTKSKSCVKIGDLKIYNSAKFNWIQRKMWKIFFNVEIESIVEV